MNALHDLADSSLDSRLIAQLGDILATLADDDTSFFGGYDGAQSQLGLSILLVGPRRRFSVGSESRLAVVELNAVQADSKVVSVGRKVVLIGRHGRTGVVDVWWCGVVVVVGLGANGFNVTGFKWRSHDGESSTAQSW